MRELTDTLPVAVYTTDVAGRITHFDEAAASLWGRRPVLGEDKCVTLVAKSFSGGHAAF